MAQEEEKNVEAEEVEKIETESKPNEVSAEDQYSLYINLNNTTEEDYTFLLTALWHWDKLYPRYSQQHVKSIDDIIQKVDETEKDKPSEESNAIELSAKKEQEAKSESQEAEIKLKDQIKQFNENKVKNYEQMYGKNPSGNFKSGPRVSKKRNRRVLD